MSVPNCSTGSEVQLVDAQGHALDIQPDGSLNVNATVVASIGEVEISNDAGNPVPVTGTVLISNTSIEIANDVGNPVPIIGAVSVTNPGLTDAELRATPVPVSGTVAISNPSVEISNDIGSPVPVTGTVTITDGSGPVTVDGTVTVANPGLTDAQLRATPVPVSGTVTITDGAGPITVDGSVAVTSVIPGTAANTLGKAEDAAHASGDVGVFALGVRNDAAATRTSADGDYSPISTDGAGRIGISDLGGTISVDDGGGILTVDGTVEITNDVGSPIPVTGALTISNPGLTDAELRAAVVPVIDAAGNALLTSIVVALNPTATAPNGQSAYRNISVLNVGSVVKASAGKIYTLGVINNQAGNRFLKLYNKAVAPTNADVPVMTLGLSASDGYQLLTFEGGLQFSNGIGVRATTGVADADNGAPGANQVILNIGFR